MRARARTQANAHYAWFDPSHTDTHTGSYTGTVRAVLNAILLIHYNSSHTQYLHYRYGMVTKHSTWSQGGNSSDDSAPPSLCNVPWDYVIIDEAHQIKNVNTKTSAAVRRVCEAASFRPNDDSSEDDEDSEGSEGDEGSGGGGGGMFESGQSRVVHRLLLTGTPIQNNLVEYWSLMDLATAGTVLGDQVRDERGMRDNYPRMYTNAPVYGSCVCAFGCGCERV